MIILKKSFAPWQIGGFVFTAVLGTLLHFLYDITGGSIIVAPFSAVNESIWEHIKLIYFPMLVFAFIEYRFAPWVSRNFFCVKLAGFCAGLLLIPMLYYTYTGALGIFIDIINILIFFVSAAAAYFIEWWLLEKNAFYCKRPLIAMVLILVVGAVFVLFTFVTPTLPIFRDPLSGG